MGSCCEGDHIAGAHIHKELHHVTMRNHKRSLGSVRLDQIPFFMVLECVPESVIMKLLQLCSI